MTSLGPKRLLWVDIDRAATDAEAAVATVAIVLVARLRRWL